MPKTDFPPAIVTHAEPAFFSSQIDDARRFSLNLKPSRTEALAVVCGGYERCAADYRVERATFRYHSIEFVAGGRGALVLDGTEHPLNAGDIFTYGPNVPHTITSDPRDRLVKYFVDFTGRRAAALLHECGLSPGTLVQTAAPEAIMRLLDDLIATAQRRGPRSPAICGLILEQLLLRTFETRIPARSLGSKAFGTFQACRRYINENYLSIIDLGQVAAACDVDGSYLCRLFQRFERQGPYHYLMQLKMTAAAQLLSDRTLLVKQIGERMGFADQFHFSRAFRRVHGLSPRDFQRLHEMR
ncbi:MAG TPA: AraC family transcriptional regulator [Tepidisphaeraceae bacterium]|jgi:AraC-like DNA-binding protein|nr:AraC family transcriptional regulator [Tepidisphaeraceae bacterium]